MVMFMNKLTILLPGVFLLHQKFYSAKPTETIGNSWIMIFYVIIM